MQHQFGIFASALDPTSEQGSGCSFGYPQYVVLLVIRHDAVHLLEVADVASPDRLLAIDVQLTEVHGSAVEVGHTGHQPFALPFPACDGHAASDDGTVALYAESTVLRAQPQGVVQIIGACTQMQRYFVGLAQTAHLASLSHSIL